jgi:hypothetical protein
MFTVWSPFDGQPIPAPNKTERDILLAQGYHADPPDGLATGGLIDPESAQIRLVGEFGPEQVELPPGESVPPSDEP